MLPFVFFGPVGCIFFSLLVIWCILYFVLQEDNLPKVISSEEKRWGFLFSWLIMVQELKKMILKKRTKGALAWAKALRAPFIRICYKSKHRWKRCTCVFPSYISQNARMSERSCYWSHSGHEDHEFTPRTANWEKKTKRRTEWAESEPRAGAEGRCLRI